MMEQVHDSYEEFIKEETESLRYENWRLKKTIQELQQNNANLEQENIRLNNRLVDWPDHAEELGEDW